MDPQQWIDCMLSALLGAIFLLAGMLIGDAHAEFQPDRYQEYIGTNEGFGAVGRTALDDADNIRSAIDLGRTMIANFPPLAGPDENGEIGTRWTEQMIDLLYASGVEFLARLQSQIDALDGVPAEKLKIQLGNEITASKKCTELWSDCKTNDLRLVPIYTQFHVDPSHSLWSDEKERYIFPVIEKGYEVFIGSVAGYNGPADQEWLYAVMDWETEIGPISMMVDGASGHYCFSLSGFECADLLDDFFYRYPRHWFWLAEECGRGAAERGLGYACAQKIGALAIWYAYTRDLYPEQFRALVWGSTLFPEGLPDTPTGEQGLIDLFECIGPSVESVERDGEYVVINDCRVQVEGIL